MFISSFLTLLLAAVAVAAPAPQFGGPQRPGPPTAPGRPGGPITPPRPPVTPPRPPVTPPRPTVAPPRPTIRPPPGRPTSSSRPGTTPTPVTSTIPAAPTSSAPTTPAPPADSLVCDASAAVLQVPAGQTALPAPSGAASFVLLGAGTQNYTCSDAGTYTSAGALADLYDISCLANKDPSAFDSIQTVAMDALIAAGGNSLGGSFQGNPKVGLHYFQPNPAGGLSPIWDFRGDCAIGNPDAFVLAAKKGNTAAPTGAQDVDWLFLTGSSGALATQIYRTHTQEGQPPTSCTPGSAPITVKYTSKYWLDGSTVTV
jgi:hypothetical protein